MPFVAMIVFGASLVGIVALFLIKRAEVRRGARFAENMRSGADAKAVQLKQSLLAAEGHIENTPFLVSALARWGVHVGALSFARLARTSAEQAHRLADLVSHKHRFERRETKSEFLRRVSERPVMGEPAVAPTPLESAAVPTNESVIESPVIVESEPVAQKTEIPMPIESSPKPKRKRKRKVATK